MSHHLKHSFNSFKGGMLGLGLRVYDHYLGFGAQGHSKFKGLRLRKFKNPKQWQVTWA